MLKLYYHPLSPIARRVEIALLEQNIDFEPVLVDLGNKRQLKADYLALNPFHHVPTLVHNDVRLIESIAILDYLNLQFCEGCLSPDEPSAVARMRMVQMVATNELLPKLVSVAIANELEPLAQAISRHLETCFLFLDGELGDLDYFGGDRINLADIVVGSTVPLFVRLGVPLQGCAALEAWCDRVTQRPAWQQTRPNDADSQKWQRWIQLKVKRRQQQLARQ